MTDDHPQACTRCGSTVQVARRWIDARRDPLLGGTWTSGLLCAACASRQETPPTELGDPERLAQGALEELEHHVEAGERSLRECGAARSQGLWARYGLQPPTYEAPDDPGEPCEICGYGTRPPGPVDWDLVECPGCHTRVRVHAHCGEQVRAAFPEVDCPRCGRVWPEWWKRGAAARSDRP